MRTTSLLTAILCIVLSSPTYAQNISVLSSLTAADLTDGIADAAPETAEVFYNPANGEVSIAIGAPGPNGIGGISLRDNSAAGNLINSANLDSSQLSVSFVAASNEVAAVDFVTPLPSGTFSIGEILSIGQSSTADFDSTLAGLDFSFQAIGVGSANGSTADGLRFNILSTSVVPEPSSLAILSMAALSLFAKRRRSAAA